MGVRLQGLGITSFYEYYICEIAKWKFMTHKLKKSFRTNPLALLKTMKSFQCSECWKKKPCKTHINKAII